MMVASRNGPNPAAKSFAEAQAAWPPASRPAATGVLRQVAQDFCVDEELGFEPAGSGEHLYVRVRCHERTTPQAQAVLARCLGVAAMDVGYAGMKDRQAITRQWFSVRAPQFVDAVPDDPRVVIEARARHVRKLRPGDHRANRFAIVVKDVGGDWDENLAQLAGRGFPNYFGEQRFGRCGGNIPRALAWVRAGRPRCRRFVRALHISTLRAQIFNDVLGSRVRDGSWRTALDGDPGTADGRARTPTGPLWGRGRPPAAATTLALEQAVVERHREATEALEFTGSQQARRALVTVPEDLVWEKVGAKVGANLHLGFTLPPGAYATRLLAEVFARPGAVA